MGARQPITTQLDAEGQTIVYVPPVAGGYTPRTTGAQEITWRLPVNVAVGNNVELTNANRLHEDEKNSTRGQRLEVRGR